MGKSFEIVEFQTFGEILSPYSAGPIGDSLHHKIAGQVEIFLPELCFYASKNNIQEVGLFARVQY